MAVQLKGVLIAGLTCSSTEKEQVLNSLENTQKSMKKTRKIEQLEYQQYLVI